MNADDVLPSTLVVRSCGHSPCKRRSQFLRRLQRECRLKPFSRGVDCIKEASHPVRIVSQVRAIFGSCLGGMPATALHVGVFLKVPQSLHVYAHVCGEFFPGNLEAYHNPFHTPVCKEECLMGVGRSFPALGAYEYFPIARTRKRSKHPVRSTC